MPAMEYVIAIGDIDSGFVSDVPASNYLATHTVLLFLYGLQPSVGTTTIADTAGNTWRRIRSIQDTTGGAPRITSEIWAADVHHAITAGDIITTTNTYSPIIGSEMWHFTGGRPEVDGGITSIASGSGSTSSHGSTSSSDGVVGGTVAKTYDVDDSTPTFTSLSVPSNTGLVLSSARVAGISIHIPPFGLDHWDNRATLQGQPTYDAAFQILYSAYEERVGTGFDNFSWEWQFHLAYLPQDGAGTVSEGTKFGEPGFQSHTAFGITTYLNHTYQLRQNTLDAIPQGTLPVQLIGQCNFEAKVGMLQGSAPPPLGGPGQLIGQWRTKRLGG